MHCVDAPVLHEYDDIPGVPHNCVDPPVQRFVFPVIAQFGGLTVVTVLLQVLTHPPLEIVTV